MTRPDGWEAALDRVIVEHGRADYSWGGSNCFSLAMDAAAACGFDNPHKGLMTYKTEAGSARALRKLGHDTLSGLLGSMFDPVSIADVQRGDLAIVERDGVEACGVVSAAGLAVKGETGVWFESLLAAKQFFKVG